MTSSVLATLASQLLPLKPATGEPAAGQAAVIILLSENTELSLLYTKRSEFLRHHAGEVCFPGGMWEPGDRDLAATAVREMTEEIGLAPESITLLGRLESAQTRAGTQVMPFVASYDARASLQANPAELDAIFHVPLRSFFGEIEQQLDHFELAGKSYSLPAYHYQGFRIWGFTALITARFLRLVEQLAVKDLT